jgi:Chaperone of endosialidase
MHIPFTLLSKHMSKNIHAWVQKVASRFLPDVHHLPSNHAGKNLVFLLWLFGVASIVLSTTWVDAANWWATITTNIQNNVMTIDQLRVTTDWLPNSPVKVELNSTGIRLDPAVAASGVLKRDTNGYIIQDLVQGTNIANNTIDGTKILNNTITNEKIVDNTITNIKIATGTITCDRLNIPGFNCGSVTPPDYMCPGWQFFQWITSTGMTICVAPPGGISCTAPDVPVYESGARTCRSCAVWETLIFEQGTWQCKLYSTTWSSLWIDWWASRIYNQNLTWNVGIGTNAPTHTLTVSGTARVIGSGTPALTWSTGGTVWTVWSLAAADASTIFTVLNGKVGILTANPQYTLDVVGTIRAAEILTTSDARKKTDIAVIDNALSSLLGINWYSYTLKSNGTKQYWVIAQQVEQFFPYLVTTDANGYKAVNYNGLIAPVIQAIHELDAKMQTIEAKYQENETRIDALEKLLSK